MICRHKLYHFMVANTDFTAPLTRRSKTKICDHKMIQFMPANHSITNVLSPKYTDHVTDWGLGPHSPPYSVVFKVLLISIAQILKMLKILLKANSRKIKFRELLATKIIMSLYVEINVALREQICQKISSKRVNVVNYTGKLVRLGEWPFKTV